MGGPRLGSGVWPGMYRGSHWGGRTHALVSEDNFRHFSFPFQGNVGALEGLRLLTAVSALV